MAHRGRHAAPSEGGRDLEHSDAAPLSSTFVPRTQGVGAGRLSCRTYNDRSLRGMVWIAHTLPTSAIGKETDGWPIQR
jgi:hypothetical protein